MTNNKVLNMVFSLMIAIFSCLVGWFIGNMLYKNLDARSLALIVLVLIFVRDIFVVKKVK